MQQYHSGVIYARLSTLRGDESLERMVRELTAFAASRNIPISDVIAEEGKSAWWGHGARKGEWPEVYDGLATGRWDVLVCRSADRTSRDLIETINLVRLYGKVGFGFYALNGDNLDDPKSATLRGLVADWESTEKSHRLKLKWADKAAKGDYHPGRWRPFGYQYTHDQRGTINGLAVDDFEADIIREVAGRLTAGESAHAIALDLERRDVPTVSGAQWQRMMVVRLIKPATAGLRSHQGSLSQGNWTPILDRETYEACRLAMKRGYSPPLGWNARKHLLTGLVLCGLCGVPAQCNGRIYQCMSKNTRAGKRGCGKTGRTARHLDHLITETTLAYLERQDLEVQATVETDWSPAIELASSEVAEINAAYQGGDITAAEWVTGLKVARQKLSRAEQGRSEQLQRLTGRSAAKLAGDDARQRWTGLNLSQQRAILFELFSAVAYVEVVWREPGADGQS